MLNKIFQHTYQYLRLMRWHRPVGFLLLLWPTLWALWIASQGIPNKKILMIFILGVVLTRSAGCVINDIADRNFDRQVKRTQDRPLATNAITLKEAWILFIILTLMAFILVLFLNRLTILLAFVGIAIAMIYPLMKRYTYLPQFILGMAFNWGVPMAFAAVTNTIPKISWFIYLIALLWTVIYDTIYALVDRDDDIQIGVKSTAILFGSKNSLIIGILQFVMLLLLIVLGICLSFSFWFYLSVLFTAGLFIYQQYLLRSKKSSAWFKAFLNNQWVGLIIFLGVFLSY